MRQSVMATECPFCCDNSSERFTLPSIIKVLHSIISALEVKTHKEKEDREQLQVLDRKVNEISAETNLILEERARAEKRSDLYKQRFLDAQETIKLLHEKNVQLSDSQKKMSSKPPSHFLFEAPATSHSRISEASNEPILAPDTCAFELKERSPINVDCISSGEEDFQEPQSRRSPKTNIVIKKTKQNTIESYFTVPKSPASAVNKMKNAASSSVVDFDETRLNVDNSLDVSSALTDSEMDKVNEEMDSIPPSPVLTGERKRQLSRIGTRWRKTEPSRSITENKNTTNRKMDDPDETFLIEQVEGNQIFKSDTILTQIDKTISTSTKSLQANTSLDEIFDKTYGNLETTSMLLADSCGTEIDDYDDEMDHLLLEDAEMPASPKVLPPKRRNERFHDSFDAPPKKEINYKPNEVVRKRDEREKLDAKSCPQCESYYSDLPEGDRRNAMKKFCRHKHVTSPPSTPEHFWEVEIPSTAECRRRGYITDKTRKPDQDKQELHSFRRKRPLQPFSGGKG